jgi:hypothetical protein
MGIIKNFTNLFKRNYNPENPSNNIIPPLDYGENTSAGIGVSENNSLTLAAVWACVRTLSESIASLARYENRRERYCLFSSYL